MASIIDLKTFTDKRGKLTVIDNVLPFDIKRVFYIYGVDNSVRGGHRHKKTQQAVICLTGSCIVSCTNNHTREDFILDSPSLCLIVNPEDWHTMHNFSTNAMLMVFASEPFDSEDYIFDPYLI